MQGAGWRDESMRPWKLTWAIAVNPEEHCRFKVLIGTLQISIILVSDLRVWDTRVQLCHPSDIGTSSGWEDISNCDITICQPSFPTITPFSRPSPLLSGRGKGRRHGEIRLTQSLKDQPST
jgi:hypothetical protein